jgi:hypothetical protein
MILPADDDASQAPLRTVRRVVADREKPLVGTPAVAHGEVGGTSLSLWKLPRRKGRSRVVDETAVMSLPGLGVLATAVEPPLSA